MSTIGCPAKMWKMQAEIALVIKVSGIPIRPAVFFSVKKNISKFRKTTFKLDFGQHSLNNTCPTNHCSILSKSDLVCSCLVLSGLA